MLNRAKELFVNNCGICHAIHKEKNLQLTLGLQFSVLWLIEQVLIKRQMASYRILTKTQKILKQNKEKSMLDRRKF